MIFLSISVYTFFSFPSRILIIFFHESTFFFLLENFYLFFAKFYLQKGGNACIIYSNKSKEYNYVEWKSVNFRKSCVRYRSGMYSRHEKLFWRGGFFQSRYPSLQRWKNRRGGLRTFGDYLSAFRAFDVLYWTSRKIYLPRRGRSRRERFFAKRRRNGVGFPRRRDERAFPYSRYL